MAGASYPHSQRASRLRTITSRPPLLFNTSTQSRSQYRSELLLSLMFALHINPFASTCLHPFVDPKSNLIYNDVPPGLL
ncbi:hypothetical protein L226DRAFT_87620 [Lentinus tigrinus ALCF2SS1-7]|uniref:uncharacterized protein n=1 Tax=Lentinus tigrinus ALCF2SS1-7 TaxID=1328758 RepID=UPI001165D3E6|nr:hypothetical protein L226DRAFT_87620 [Lentinus tigrinus ALCF2SS1-7]